MHCEWGGRRNVSKGGEYGCTKPWIHCEWGSRRNVSKGGEYGWIHCEWGRYKLRVITRVLKSTEDIVWCTKIWRLYYRKINRYIGLKE